MATDITSNEWHLRGVSIEVRKAIRSLADMRDVDQGVLVDELLRKSPELTAAIALFRSAASVECPPTRIDGFGADDMRETDIS